MYRYLEDLDAAKAWFKANIETIMTLYSAAHRAQKEDIYLSKFTLH